MQNTTNSIVFLDFAGVLHPSGTETFEHIPAFQDFMRQHPKVLVVFSPPQRLTQPLTALRQLFARDLAQRFIDVTPSLPVSTPARNEAEIRTWLLVHNAYGCHWAALAAESACFAPGCGELVRCSPQKGLGPEEFNELRQVLHFTPPRVPGPPWA